jgi:hypothetical protein
MPRFQRPSFSREPSIWDTYAGEYPAITSWGAPTYQYWWPYPFGDPSAKQGGVSPAEKLEDPNTARVPPLAPPPSRSPLGTVSPPAVDGSSVTSPDVEGSGMFPGEAGGGEGPAPSPGPQPGDVTGFDPGAASLAASAALGMIPNPLQGILGLALEAGRLAGPLALSGIPGNLQEVTLDSQGRPIRGEPVVPSRRGFMGVPLGPFVRRGDVETTFGGSIGESPSFSNPSPLGDALDTGPAVGPPGEAPETQGVHGLPGPPGLPTESVGLTGLPSVTPAPTGIGPSSQFGSELETATEAPSLGPAPEDFSGFGDFSTANGGGGAGK